jgi:hypothetical protein
MLKFIILTYKGLGFALLVLWALSSHPLGTFTIVLPLQDHPTQKEEFSQLPTFATSFDVIVFFRVSTFRFGFRLIILLKNTITFRNFCTSLQISTQFEKLFFFNHLSHSGKASSPRRTPKLSFDIKYRNM